jgi:hypothetical protein
MNFGKENAAASGTSYGGDLKADRSVDTSLEHNDDPYVDT